MGEVVRIAFPKPQPRASLRQSISTFRLEAHDIVICALKKSWDDNILAPAAATTFYALLALFPAIASFVSLYGLFADIRDVHANIAYLRGILPPHVAQMIGDQMLRLAHTRTPQLGLAFCLSFVVSFWSASGGLLSLIEGLNVAYGRREVRSFVHVRLIGFAFTLAEVLIAMGVFAFATMPVFAENMPDGVGRILDIARGLFLMGVIAGSLIAIYTWGPTGQRMGWTSVIFGAAATILLWIAVSALFSLYVSNFADYDFTYGSLGTIVGFLVWLWLSLIIVLFGGEINAQLERRIALRQHSERQQSKRR